MLEDAGASGAGGEGGAGGAGGRVPTSAAQVLAATLMRQAEALAEAGEGGQGVTGQADQGMGKQGQAEGAVQGQVHDGGAGADDDMFSAEDAPGQGEARGTVGEGAGGAAAGADGLLAGQGEPSAPGASHPAADTAPPQQPFQHQLEQGQVEQQTQAAEAGVNLPDSSTILALQEGSGLLPGQLGESHAQETQLPEGTAGVTGAHIAQGEGVPAPYLPEGFELDPSSGLHYNSIMGLYFDPTSSLFMDAGSGCWYRTTLDGGYEMVPEAGQGLDAKAEPVSG